MKTNNTDLSDENDTDGKSCLWSRGKELIQTNNYYIKKYIHGHNVKYMKRSYPKGKKTSKLERRKSKTRELLICL